MEQAYRLCPRCERYLKRTLNKVKTNILGSKLKQIGAKGLQAFNLNLNQKANKTIVYKKRLTFARISLAALVVISLLQSFTTTNQMNITKSKLDTIFNDNITTFILTILSYVSAIKILVLQLIQQILALPYISCAVAFAQMSVNYVYTYVSGDFWKIISNKISTDFLELIETNVNNADDLSLGYSTVTTNVSGCFLSVFLLFMFGLGWGPVLSLLLWSLNMILPTIVHDTDIVQQTLLFDIVQVGVESFGKIKLVKKKILNFSGKRSFGKKNFQKIVQNSILSHFKFYSQFLLVWSTSSLSIINFFMLPNKQIESTGDNNSSFHRIDSEMHSDCSDESESESVLNTSIRSDISSASKRSLWNETRVLNSTIASRTPSIYSTNSMRRRSHVISNQSIATAKAATSDLNSSFGSDNFYRGSLLDLTHDKFNAMQRSFMSGKSSGSFNRSQCPSVMSLHSLNKSYMNNVESSLRSPSRNSFYDVPNDFESGITQLSISGGKHFNAQKPSRASGSWDLFGDTVRNQKSILSPSRLSLNETHHPVNQSWLAGGYWNSTSPQKKSALPTNDYKIEQRTVAKEIFPMMSRASSKSSGFESRENSLCDDSEVERTFLVAEPTSITNTTKLNNALVKPQPQKPMVGGMNRDNYQQPATFAPSPASFAPSPASFAPSPAFDAFSNPKKSPNFNILSRSFSQFSLQQQQQATPSHFQDTMLSSSQSFASDLNRFTTTNKNLPNFKRGSLIKLHDPVSTSMDH